MTMRLRRCLLCVLLLAPFVSAAGGVRGGTPRSAETGGFRYLVLETGGAVPEADLPMIVGLHYSGATPEAMLEYFADFGVPARIVLPQGPHPRRKGWTWFADGAASDDAQRNAAADAMVERLAGFVAAAGDAHPTRGRPVVMGISYGADLAFLLALRHPDAVAAAFPIAARLPPAWMPATNTCKPRCPPIRAMHGAADTVVPMAPTTAAVQRLRAMGIDATLTPYSGVAHDFDAAMRRDFIRQVEPLLGDQPSRHTACPGHSWRTR